MKGLLVLFLLLPSSLIAQEAQSDTAVLVFKRPALACACVDSTALLLREVLARNTAPPAPTLGSHIRAWGPVVLTLATFIAVLVTRQRATPRRDDEPRPDDEGPH